METTVDLSGSADAARPRLERNRLSIPEIAERLSIGRLTVYSMLENGIIPGVRVGNRWIVTRYAFEQWERTCGMKGSAVSLPKAA